MPAELLSQFAPVQREQSTARVRLVPRYRLAAGRAFATPALRGVGRRGRGVVRGDRSVSGGDSNEQTATDQADRIVLDSKAGRPHCRAVLLDRP